MWPSAALLQWCSPVPTHLGREITAGDGTFCETSEWPSANMNDRQSTRAMDSGETFCYFLLKTRVSVFERVIVCLCMYLSSNKYNVFKVISLQITL